MAKAFISYDRDLPEKHLAADIDGDGEITGGDIGVFVHLLFGGIAVPETCAVLVLLLGAPIMLRKEKRNSDRSL